ncbi:Bug family tripartite tricarboxylate transporter substrate binding protein [Cupriavidus plantarum]|uniref:Tripartite-type tricarboxylate transporter receptor subunit TctC n=1 Tax=Cupriavidus plantarum TaxID=942865 RepID=A0A316F1P8_9BURK|nr:tripartite tricarboxylate transporter substrate binding protein [Cupriavidus plantarum]PWK37449.1 tripartite-type tricarboxylate transporter receptor subunit TctC [Cupriavidus plantarum]
MLHRSWIRIALFVLSVLSVLSVLFLGLSVPALTAHAAAGKWPDKPVTLIVPYAPGGGTDIVSRLVAQKLSELWGQSVVVENRPGANGVIGTSHVAKSSADGYTLMMVVGSHAINPVLMKSLPYDTAAAFTPITRLAVSPMVLVVSKKSPYKNLTELVDAARKQPLGVGYSEGTTRLTGELFRQIGHLQTVSVPYKGGSQIMVDVIGGHLAMGFTSVLTAMPHVQGGNLRVIGVAADERMSIFPDAMTFKEAGLAGVESLNWYGLFGPKGMPQQVVNQINADLRRVTSDPAVARQMQDQGANVVLTPPAQFNEFIVSETRKWSAVAQRGGIQPE